jgi:hypothetical protein
MKLDPKLKNIKEFSKEIGEVICQYERFEPDPFKFTCHQLRFDNHIKGTSNIPREKHQWYAKERESTKP